MLLLLLPRLPPFQFLNGPLPQSLRLASKQSLFLNTLPRLSLFPHTLLSLRLATRPRLLPSLDPPSQKHVTRPPLRHVTRLSPPAPQKHPVPGKVIESCKDAF